MPPRAGSASTSAELQPKSNPSKRPMWPPSSPLAEAFRLRPRVFLRPPCPTRLADRLPVAPSAKSVPPSPRPWSPTPALWTGRPPPGQPDQVPPAVYSGVAPLFFGCNEVTRATNGQQFARNFLQTQPGPPRHGRRPRGPLADIRVPWPHAPLLPLRSGLTSLFVAVNNQPAPAWQLVSSEAEPAAPPVPQPPPCVKREPRRCCRVPDHFMAWPRVGPFVGRPISRPRQVFPFNAGPAEVGTGLQNAPPKAVGVPTLPPGWRRRTCPGKSRPPARVARRAQSAPPPPLGGT